jgi:hypothetical protein
MANWCEYRLRIKGKRDDCYFFLNSMNALEEYDIRKEKGTDDNFVLEAIGYCKWDVYSYTMPVNKSFNYEEQRASITTIEDCWRFFSLPPEDKSKLFNVDVLISWTDIDEPFVDDDFPEELDYSFEHWNNGERIDLTEEDCEDPFFTFLTEDYM